MNENEGSAITKEQIERQTAPPGDQKGIYIQTVRHTHKTLSTQRVQTDRHNGCIPTK